MMKITRVEACWLQVPIPTAQQHVSDFGRAATFDAALVRICLLYTSPSPRD